MSDDSTDTLVDGFHACVLKVGGRRGGIDLVCDEAEEGLCHGVVRVGERHANDYDAATKIICKVDTF